MTILLLTGCSSQKRECPDLTETFRRNAVIDCHFGILHAMERFLPQIKGKVTRKQIDAAWEDCGYL